MKDATFQRRLGQLAHAKLRYLAELQVCEDEYERRYGRNPSEWDDDYWIDFAHTAGKHDVAPTVMAVEINALLAKRLAATDLRKAGG